MGCARACANRAGSVRAIAATSRVARLAVSLLPGPPQRQGRSTKNVSLHFDIFVWLQSPPIGRNPCARLFASILLDIGGHDGARGTVFENRERREKASERDERRGCEAAARWRREICAGGCPRGQ